MPVTYKLYSNIKIYTAPLTPERNALIENMNFFLGRKCSLTHEFPQYQYVKHNLSIDLKVELPETARLDGNTKDNVGNYVKIQNYNAEGTFNADERPYYYFIMGQEWLSLNCILLHLALDSVNTYFNDPSINLASSFDGRTDIIREHCDRFEETPITYNHNQYYKRAIHRVSENIPVKLYKKSKRIISDTINDNFYLVYRTSKDLTPENIDNPVNCYLLSDNSMLISKSETGAIITLKSIDLTANKYYYAVYDDNPSGSIKFADATGDSKTLTLSATNHVIVFYKPSTSLNGKIEYYIYKKVGNYYVYERTEPIGISSFISAQLLNIKRIHTFSGKVNGVNDILSFPFITYNSGFIPPISTIPFKDLDRTDNRILKIIKLPYSPVELSFNNDELVYDKLKWTYEDGMLKLKDLTTEFEHALAGKLNLIKSNYLFKDATPPSATAYRDDTLESKLFHSDYYLDSLIYDTFSWTYKPENYLVAGRIPSENEINVEIEFKPTNTLNSKMLFHIELNSNLPALNYISDENYGEYLSIVRNNETTIYNSDYVNYIKNGYNYDKQKRSQDIFNNAFGTAVQIAGSVASAVVGVATGNPISAVASISMGAGAIQSISHNITNAIESERAINQKLNDLKNRAVSVAGSDDIDLLDFYNGNRLLEMTFEPSDRMKTLLADLFYFTGYSNPHKGIPSFNSRVWFNYVQCNPVFTEMITNKLPVDHINDLKTRFASGVTIYHQFDADYDMAQVKNNIETFFLN